MPIGRLEKRSTLCEHSISITFTTTVYLKADLDRYREETRGDMHTIQADIKDLLRRVH